MSASAAHTHLRSADRESVAQALKTHEAIAQTRKAKMASLHLIDLEWVQASKSKQMEQSASGFVSTNDVLSSWFLNHHGATHGSIVCDCRGRLPALAAGRSDEERAGDGASFLAGSYISSIMCGPAEFGSPFAVRRRVSEVLPI